MYHLKGTITLMNLLYRDSILNDADVVQCHKIGLHCRFRVLVNYLLMYSTVQQVHWAHLLNLTAVNLSTTCHQCHWQRLRNNTSAFFPHVGVNSRLKRTKIHSNEGGLAVLLMHVVYSDCSLSSGQRLWKHSRSALWGSFKAFHWKIYQLLSIRLLFYLLH